MTTEDKKLVIVVLEGGQEINMITLMSHQAIHDEFSKRGFDSETDQSFCEFHCIDEDGGKVNVRVKRMSVVSYMVRKKPTPSGLAIPRPGIIPQ